MPEFKALSGSDHALDQRVVALASQQQQLIYKRAEASEVAGREAARHRLPAGVAWRSALRPPWPSR